MNSILNPEAPEFYPHLTTITQSGYIKVNKSIKASNHLPIGASHDLFKTFTDFNKVTSKFSDNVVVESNQIVSTELPTIKLKSDDSDYNTDKIVDANDSLLDRININIDTVSGVNQPSDSIFVKDKNGVNVSSWNNAPVIAKIQMGSTTFIGAKNIPRPQLTFKDTTDNSESLWVPKISDKPNNIKPLALNMIYSDEGEAIGFEHPYRVELDLYHPSVELLEAESEPLAFPQPLEATPLTFVETEAQVDALVAHLCSVREMAVDVEHHSYRTYQGITCLIQITTDTGGDFIIDTLAAREHIHKLNLAFTDPKKVKVFHGAERDVVWLQRDFGVYLVGLFDTHQAARVLNLNGLSLKYLLMKYCGVDADKKYQLADWRIRPLPEELVAYARSDTHYLLFVWRRLKAELLALAAGQPRLLLAVFERSRQIAAITYNKDVVHDESHMPLYLRSKKSFNSQQMAALKMLYKWRDSQARTLDESTTYLIPNHMVLALAEALPRELQGVAACCQPTPPFVKQHLVTIHRMLLSCRDLPTEPQLYQMPASINEVLNATQHLKSYKVHDLSQIMQDGGDRPINLEQAAGLIEQFRQFNPDIAAFVPLHATCESAVTTNKVSRLNVDAKLFIPPYDRYRKYRALAQIEELKEFKDKEAKIAAIGQGDELIKAEVLQKLQAAKAHLETANKQMNGAAPPPPPAPAPAPAPPPPEEKLSKRKRKMAAKLERKESAPLITDSSEPTSTKLNEAKHKLDNSRQKVKPFQYKNVDYKKFYDETEKGHKQSKKFKKRKHF